MPKVEEAHCALQEILMLAFCSSTQNLQGRCIKNIYVYIKLLPIHFMCHVHDLKFKMDHGWDK